MRMDARSKQSVRWQEYWMRDTVRKHVGGVAVLAVDERFGLLIAVR